MDRLVCGNRVRRGGIGRMCVLALSALLGLGVSSAIAQSLSRSLDKLSDVQICSLAINATDSEAPYDWDTRSRFAAHVEEAKRRGLSTDECRVALGLQEATSAESFTSAADLSGSSYRVMPED